MSIIRSMNTGASGLRAHGEALGVVSDNIANVSTTGYKRSRALFEDVLGRSVAGAASIPMGGAGSRVAHVEQMWTQGALLATGAPTDMAISGDGLFIVAGTVDGVQGNFFSRAGQMHVDTDGYLVNPDGLRLQGYPADDRGVLAGSLGDLLVRPGAIPATPTSTVDIGLNLDPRPATSGPFLITDPGGTSDFASPVTIYDSLGAAHDAMVYYEMTGPGTWDYHVVLDGGEVTGGTAGVPEEVGSGTLTFNTDGTLDTETAGAATVNFVGATPGQVITFDFGTSITTDGGTGLDGATQFARDESNTLVSQDGYAAGEVAGMAVEEDGTITGVFTNGQRRTLGQVALATFTSEHGLARAGHNLWTETDSSGEALIGGAGSGRRGTIVSGALEGSNVDLGSEFVDLIQYQRGFQASSRIITTADEMYQEVVALKR